MSQINPMQSVMSQLAGHLALPAPVQQNPVSLMAANAMRSRNPRGQRGQVPHPTYGHSQSATHGPAARAAGPLTQHVMQAKQAAADGQHYDSFGGGYVGDGSGVDTGDDSVQTTAQLGELGGADLHNAGQVSKWDATAQNYLPVQPPVQPQQPAPQQAAAPQPKPANPYVGMPTQDLMNVPIKDQPMQIVRGTGANAQTSTFDPETHEETPVASASAAGWLAGLKGQVSDTDFNLLNQYANQPGVTPQHLMTAANDAINRQMASARETTQQNSALSREQMSVARERIGTLQGKRRDLAGVFNRASTNFARQFPGAQPNEQGQIVNPDGSVDPDATAAYKDVLTAQNVIAPVDQQLDSELKNFGAAPSPAAAPQGAGSAPVPYRPGMQFQPGMRIQTSKGVFTVAGVDAQGQPQFQAAQ